jgi:D-arabinose 1-dehydrogenase-like Zn-dependent alcohol dehydrogenase
MLTMNSVTTLITPHNTKGTGHVAIQMAKAWGATVTAVGGPNDEAFLKSQGADTFIDYTKHKNLFETVVRCSSCADVSWVRLSQYGRGMRTTHHSI